MKKRLLLVGREPNRLNQTCKLEYHLREEWTLHCLRTTQEALALCEAEGCDAVVADPKQGDQFVPTLPDETLVLGRQPLHRPDPQTPIDHRQIQAGVP